MEASTTSTSPVFGAFSQTTSVTSPSSAQNPFSSLSQQTSPFGGIPHFGKPASGPSGGFGVSGSNLFGSQMTSASTSGGSFVSKTTSPGSLFGRDTQSQAQQGFSNSATNQTSFLGGGGQTSALPSTSLFGGTSFTSASNSSQNLFGKGPQNTSTLSNSPSMSAQGLSSSDHNFRAPNKNPFGGESTPSVSSSMLFGSVKPSGSDSLTSSSTLVSSNYLFGTNVSQSSSSSQATSLFPANTTLSSSSSSRTGNSNPFGSVSPPFGSLNPPTASSLLFSGTKSNLTETGLSTSTAQLFGKPVQGTALFSTSQGGSSTISSSKVVTSSSPDSQKSLFGRPVPQTFGSTEKSGKEFPDSQKSLFGKPVPQTFGSPEGIEKESSDSQKSLFGKPVPQTFGSVEGKVKESLAFSGMKEKVSQEAPPFSSLHSASASAWQMSQSSNVSQVPSYEETGAEKSKFIFSQSSSFPGQGASLFHQSQRKERESDVSSAAQGGAAKTLGAGARLFGKALPVRDPSPIKRKETSEERDQLVERSPGKSLSKWNNRESVSALKRKGRLSSFSHNKPGTQSSFKLLSTINSRKLSKDQTAHKSLTVKNIPPEYNEEVLRNHFSQFGTVTRFRLTPAKNMLTLTYEAPESALKAKREGHYVASGAQPLSIFFRASAQGKSEKESPKQNAGMSVEDELQSLREITDYATEEDPAPKASSSFKMKSEMLRREQRRSLTPPPSSNQRSASDSSPGERRRSPTPPPTSSNGSDIKEAAPLDSDVVKDLFKSLRNARVTTTTEKIAVLDTRDKLLKLLRGRQQANLASAKAFVGTCPDMCPEKERYYREDIRRLALYEVILSTMSNVVGQKTKVDHTKAVKEYSRSSADQEEPLPLELRPLPVLFATMVFLLREVADLGGEGKWSEWYDFLWNRTRGIRKDITQQQLCALEVAELLEKCARFHIFCSERLCEEDMMSFDDKINNENLTKCLQTLKELYADLETKQGVFCPNEAEFRAYMVLMKLNEGDTLREVQQLRPQIRESGPIKFAVEAHSALNSNNYVRFFRLIEQASFLNACILHRYFNQIRSQALRTIKKAYRGTSKFPVMEMIRLLKFENALQVKVFCSYYCVECTETDVILDSRSFVEPETSIPHSRSPSLIESKQTASVGETIYGGPLPASQLAPPMSSFDEEGAFIFSKEFQQALVQVGLKLPSPGGNLMSAQQKPSAPAPVPKPSYSYEAIRSVGRTLILAETDTETISIAKEVLLEEKETWSAIASWLKDMLFSTLEEDMKSIAEEVITHEEAVLRQTIELNRQKERELAMESLSAHILAEVEKEIGLQIAQEEMSLIQKELHKQRIERCTHACAEDLLDTVVNELIEDVSTDVYQFDVVARREQLNEIERIVELRRAFRWFKIWRDNHLRRVRVRRAMLDFPAAPPSLSLPDQVTALVPIRPSDRIKRNAFFIGERVRLNVQSPMDAFRQDLHLSAHLSMASAQQMLFNIRMWQPIDLAYCVGNQILRAVQQWNVSESDALDSSSIQWKLIASLPKQTFDSSDKEQKFIHWMKAKLSRKTGKNEHGNSPPYEGEILSQYTTQLPLRGTKPPSKSGNPTLNFCLRCFHGLWNDSQIPEIKKKSLLKGSSGVLFVTDTAERLTEEKSLWNRECKRLRQLFMEKTKDPSLPLVIIIPRTTGRCVIDVDSVKASLKLDDLHKEGLLMTVHIAQPLADTGDVLVDVNAEWATQLTSCLRFLATHIPSPPCLRVKNISDHVEDTVVEHYKAPVYQDLRTRNRHQMLHQSPNVLISLYNDIIEHIAMVTSSDSLTQFSWPAPEFDNPKSDFNSDWNSETHLADVYELVTKLRLPTFRYSDRERDDWATLCKDVWNYMSTLTKKDSGSAKICLFQQITELLQSTKKQFDQYCWLALEDGPCEPSYVNMAWTDFIDACIHYRLVSLRTGHLCIEVPEDDDDTKVKAEDFKELLVYFHEEELADWEAPLSWEEALRDTENLELGQVKASIQRAAARREETMMNPTTTTITTTTSSPHNVVDEESESDDGATATDSKAVEAEPEVIAPNVWTHLRAQLQKEREETERLENILASSLEEGLYSPSRGDNSILGQRGIRDMSASLKRRRISYDNDEIPTGSSRIASPRLDLPKTRFEKIRKLDDSQEEFGESETSCKENSFEQKLSEALTSPSLSTRLADLKRELEAERAADKLFEMKMTNLLNSNFL